MSSGSSAGPGCGDLPRAGRDVGGLTGGTALAFAFGAALGGGGLAEGATAPASGLDVAEGTGSAGRPVGAAGVVVEAVTGTDLGEARQ